ncbi:hypothetical protein C8J56DRAFT_801757 [Mycena floridula]|nr:hypothetical protein C8J56DRAFT_801757 [Mycena floridula]
MVKAEASLAGIEDPSWTALLMKWRAWEQCFGFAQEGYNKEKLGGAKIRPEAVEWWTKRKRIPTPDIGDREVFARKWWLWWIHVNPDWRIKSNEGFLERKGDGDWSSMKISGVNGFLSLLICLRWWIGAASGEKEASWSEAVADMSWALDQLMELRYVYS